MNKDNLSKYNKTLKKIDITELNGMDTLSDWCNLANEFINDSLNEGVCYKISDEIKTLFEKETSGNLPIVKLKKAAILLQTYNNKFDNKKAAKEQISILRCITDIILLIDLIEIDTDDADVSDFKEDEIKGLKESTTDISILYHNLKYNLNYIILKIMNAIDEINLSDIKLIIDVGFLFLISEIDEYIYEIQQ